MRPSGGAGLRIDQRHFVARLRLAELFERSGRGALAVQHWSAVVQLAQGIDRPPPVVADALARGLRYLKEHNLAFAETLTKRFGGALPLAVATGYGADLRRPLGIAIVGGLLFSQFLTLYTTPVVYLYMDRLHQWFQRHWATDRRPIHVTD